jgi:hypothetical protein
MATGTLRGNRKYVPRGMFAKTITKKKTLGWIDYHMHKERQVCCIVWKDKQVVVLLSTHAQPISEARVREFVWRKIGGKNKKVITGPMYLQYTRNMRGVGTADQLRGAYSSLTRSHKWWHRLFFFMLDTTVSNMWIIHSDLSFRMLLEPIAAYKGFGYWLVWAQPRIFYFRPQHSSRPWPEESGNEERELYHLRCSYKLVVPRVSRPHLQDCMLLGLSLVMPS